MPRLPGGRSRITTTARNPVSENLNPFTDGTVRGGIPEVDEPIPEPIPPVSNTYFRFDESATARPDRLISTSSSILGNIVPEFFGEGECTGYFAAIDPDQIAERLVVAFVFALGEQEDVTNVKINDELVSSLSWVTSAVAHTGNGDNLSALLTSMTDWSSEETDLWKTLAHVPILIDTNNASVPGALNVTATLHGRKFSDFRTSTTAAHTNPIDIAYHIRTHADWIENATARLDDDSWEVIANWCDTTMTDSTKRYTWVGRLERRDPDGALSDVLGSVLADEYVGPDGTVRLWCEKTPVGVPGFWTATASATITSALNGDTTDLTIGDTLIMHDGSTVTVVSITSGTVFVIDRAVTIASKKFYVTSNIHLSGDDWVSVPEAQDIDLGTIPDVVQVRYFGPNIGDEHVYPEDITAFSKRTEVTVNGCTVGSQARRVSETRRDVRKLQRITWHGTASAKAHGLEPGDALLISDDVLDKQIVTVMSPIKVRKNGYVDLIMRFLDLDSYSSSIYATSWPGRPGGGWTGESVKTAHATEVVSKTAAYTAASTPEMILCDATSAAFTVSLPAAGKVTGYAYYVKKIDSSSNAITIDAANSETIDGELTKVISTQWTNIMLISDGTNWVVV